MIGICALWLAGLACSAFFSGSETGFYRVNRVRLTLDSHDRGDWNLRGLVWLANHPALFVATTLIGNNLANYLSSLAMVLGTQRLLGTSTFYMEILVTIALTPLIFVYGELLPKQLFFDAPNRMLRLASRPFLSFAVLVAPATAVLWGLGRILQGLVGQAPERAHSLLARKELQQLLEEGHEVGLLRPTQRRMAQGLFAVAGLPAIQFATPVGRLPSVILGSPKKEAQRLAERHKMSYLLVTESRGRRLLGYVKMADLDHRAGDTITTFRTLTNFAPRTTLLNLLITLRGRNESVARLLSEDRRNNAVITTRRLSEVLLQI